MILFNYTDTKIARGSPSRYIIVVSAFSFLLVSGQYNCPPFYLRLCAAHPCAALGRLPAVLSPFCYLRSASSVPSFCSRCSVSGISVAGVSFRFISSSSISPAFYAGCSFRWHSCRRLNSSIAPTASRFFSLRPLCRILSGVFFCSAPDNYPASLRLLSLPSSVYLSPMYRRACSFSEHA